ncbi:exodeoxyribonuclease [Cylas formicarius]|uniref:exodeoxyribonuclease n=1 Tax=Cylas formicarius TaxID=197179 RepID=UPI002958946C|nr:exodeoxyribonuclease [Cylas formicarius]
MPPKRKPAKQTDTIENDIKSKKVVPKLNKIMEQEENITKRVTRKRQAKQELVESGDEPKKKKITEKKTAPKRVKETEGTKQKAQKDSKEKTPLNDTITKWEEINFLCSQKNAKGKKPNLKVTSWNVDGIRAWLKKDGLKIVKYDNPDILCLQETKCSNEKLPNEVKDIEGYKAYWCSSKKEGYAGVAVYTKIEPINVIYGIDHADHDNEGRCITLEYDTFFLICVYVPNAGRGLVTLSKRLEWNKIFKSFIKELEEKKPIIICGDMNVAHNEIDLANPKTNKKNAGFTQEERDGMTEFLEDGYFDSFRMLYPDKKDVYTFWSYMSKSRTKNVGWRLDYFILSKKLKDSVCDVVVRSEILGSDHCPISLFIAV